MVVRMLDSDITTGLQRIVDYQKSYASYNKIKRNLFRLCFRLCHRLKVTGKGNIPKGAALIATAHGGGFDLDIVGLSDCCLTDRQSTH